VKEVLQIAMEQLWRLTVVGPAWLLTPEGRRTLFSAKTLRRVLMSLAFTLILVGVAQTLPFDIALIFAGDVLTYAEVAAIVWIATANGVLTASLKAATRAVASPAPARGDGGPLGAAAGRGGLRRPPTTIDRQSSTGRSPPEAIDRLYYICNLR